MKEGRKAFSFQRANILIILLVVLTLIGWEWMVQNDKLSALFFPAPSEIGKSFIEMIEDGELFTHLQATLSRFVLGLIVGGIPGLLLGWLMGWSRGLRGLIDPIIAAIHPLPKISLLPFVMILFGIGEASKVVIIAVAAFFPILINAMAGVQQINKDHFDVARSYGANNNQIFRRIVLPGSLPVVVSGVRLAANMALLLTIAVELITAQEGFGSVIWLAWQTLRIEKLYISLAVIAALGMMLNVLLNLVAKILMPWQMELEA